MLEKVSNILTAIKAELSKRPVKAKLLELKVKYLGKSGEFTSLLKGLKDVSGDQKAEMGKRLNEARNEIEELFTLALNAADEAELQERLEKEALDVTLSKKSIEVGSQHLLTRVVRDICDAFIGLGFTMKDGPEIESDYYNFTALNIPEDHPARDRQDSFYIDEHMMLRTQTSTVQVRTMETEKPPFRIICPGKVYRPDDDSTHSPMFQQIEGLVVDKHITLCDLQGILDEFAKAYFSKDSKTRLRPSFFPFTEPSVEVDVSCAMCGGKGCRLCKGTGWIEVLGAGIVNPAVLEKSGIDSSVYSGFAFGLGVERAAMLKYRLPDMRLMFENDIRFLKQYK